MKHLRKFNENSVSEYGEYILNKLKQALKKFGTYSYEDKGASEILNLAEFDKYLNKKSADEVAQILSYLLDHDEYSQILVRELISNLDHREDFDEILSKDERFEY